jgi:cobalt-zinc-cadmium efflux system protein
MAKLADSVSSLLYLPVTGSSMLNNAEFINRPPLECCHPNTHAPISMSHGHGHHHDHHRHDGHHGRLDENHHNPYYYNLTAHRPRQRRALLISLALTALMMVIEFAASWMTGSLMLTSDAVHMLSHAAALGVSLLAIMLARRQLGDHLPFGLYRIEVLAALVNGLSLACLSLWIIYEAVTRLLRPVNVTSHELIVVAALGLATNAVTAIILFRAGYEDLNTRGALLHMLADGFSSVIIVTGAVVMAYTGWAFIDPALSIVVSLIIGKWSWGLLRDSSLILLERKPDHVDLAEIERELLGEFLEIREVHDLHVWEITTHFLCLSAHIVLDDLRLSETQRVRAAIIERLRRRFGIAHAVIQFEC